MIFKEHILQRHIKTFVRDAVDAPHQFLAIDRGKASGRFTHLRQRAAGAVKGTPDTLLIVGAIRAWCECKAPGKHPDEAQEAMGATLHALGDHWTWQTTVTGYCEWLQSLGVPLRHNAYFQAMHHDAAIAGVIARAEAKQAAPKAKTARKAEPRYVATPARGRRMIKGMLP